jgi:hypothetical protein
MSGEQLKVTLDFGTFALDAALFDTSVGRSVSAALPVTVELTGWGRGGVRPHSRRSR